MRIRLTLGGLSLLLIAFAFNALLNFASFEKLHRDAALSVYGTIGKDLARRIEAQIRSGSDIAYLTQTPRLLDRTRQIVIAKLIEEEKRLGRSPARTSGEDASVFVTLPDRRILYTASQGGGRLESEWPFAAEKKISSLEAPPPGYGYREHQNAYFINLPIRGISNRQIAGVVIAFSAKPLKSNHTAIFKDAFKVGTIILAAAATLLAVLLFLLTTKPQTTRGFPKKKISLVLLLIIGSAQILFSYLNTAAFKDRYQDIAREKAEVVTTLLKTDVEAALGKTVSLEKLEKADLPSQEVIAAIPELNALAILNKEGQAVHREMKTSEFEPDENNPKESSTIFGNRFQTDSDYGARREIVDADGHIAGFVSVDIAKEVLHNSVFTVYKDIATVVMISFLFLGEMLILFYMFIGKQAAGDSRPEKIHCGLIRPVFFLLMFGIDLSISFIPLHMEKLYEPMLGLPKDMVLSLPVSLSVFFTGIGFFIAGVWNDRKGWHQPFLAGVALAGIGNLHSWFSPDAYHFVIAQAVTGLGYGLAFMASQGFVIAYTDDDSKARGFATLFAALYAGGFCGSSAGAMLAERMGYRPVFLFGAIIILATIGYVLVFMRNTLGKPAHLLNSNVSARLRMGQIIRFLSRRNVIAVVLFSSIPANLAMIGFLNYFNPVYLSRIGVSQSDIGRTFMIYCAFAIYIGPWISRYIDASDNKKGYMIMGGLLGGLAFTIYYFFQGFFATVIAIFLLGFSHSFVFVAQAAYLLKLKVTRELGSGTAIAIFRVVNRLGQVIGPFVFGGLIIAPEIGKSMTLVGIGYLVLTILFMLVSQSDKRILEMEKQRTKEAHSWMPAGEQDLERSELA